MRTLLAFLIFFSVQVEAQMRFGQRQYHPFRHYNHNVLVSVGEEDGGFVGEAEADPGDPILPPKEAVEPAITDSLVAFWCHDEQVNGATKRDTTDNEHHLTNWRSVNYNTTVKVKGEAASYADASYRKYLYAEDHADFSFAGENSFTLMTWVRPYIQEVWDPIVISKTPGRIVDYQNDFEYLLYAHGSDDGAGKWTFAVGNNNGNRTEVASDSALAENNRWFLIVAWYNSGTDSIYIRVNNGSINSAKVNYGPVNGNGRLRFYSFDDSNEPSSHHFDGFMDDTAIWKNRCPTYFNGWAMCDSLWNGGAGWDLY